MYFRFGFKRLSIFEDAVFPAPLYYAYLKLKQIIMFSFFFQRKGSLEKQKKFSCTKIFSTGRSAGRQTVHQRVDLWHHADYQHLVNVQVAEQTQKSSHICY